MTYQELAEQYRWRQAEKQTIGAAARQAGFAVTDKEIGYNFGIWRDWYYGTATLAEVAGITGIVPEGVESDTPYVH